MIKRNLGTAPSGIGVGVDARGGAVIDPTENVKALNEASVTRLDDLRIAEQRSVELVVTALERRLDSEIIHVKEMAHLNQEHQRQLDAAESARIDSIRQVDVLATATTAAQALTAIQTLQGTTNASAETLRVAVANQATTLAAQLTTTVAEINKRLSSLEASSYEGMGKQKVVDPQSERLAMMVENLTRMQSTGAGKTEGVSSTWAMIVAGIAVVAALFGMWNASRVTPQTVGSPSSYTAPR